MNYKELRDILNNEISEAQLNQTVTAYLGPEDEFVPISSVLITGDEEDRLDPGSVCFSV